MKTTRILLAVTLLVTVMATIVVAQGPPAGGGQGGGVGAGAGGGRGPGGPGGAGGGQGRGGRGGRGGGGIPMPLVITNTAWTDGGDIPAKYAGATGVSPALSWTGAPMTTQSFAVVMHDLDVSPGGSKDDVLHWIVWDIPATTTMLPEGLKAGDQADGTRQGRGITGQNAYFGPGPPAGHPAHHYIIEIYALDTKLNLPATATRAEFIAAIDTHIVARGAYYGKFKPA